MQEFLASYAVQVDEDGARRLQRILDQNRESGQQLAEVFSQAAEALAALKRELSSSSGLKNVLSILLSGSRRIPPSLLSGLGGMGAAASGGSSGAAGFAGASAYAASLAGGLAGASALPVSADLSGAEDAFSAFRARLESERPMIRVNTSGITSAVSSAIASVRSMLSSVQVTVPVKAVASLDTSGLSSGGSGNTISLAGRSGTSLSRYGLGGRVSAPTLALIAEEGNPEYIIPTDNEARAVPLLRNLLRELSGAAKRSVLTGMGAELLSDGAAAFSLAGVSNLSAPARGGLSGGSPDAALPGESLQASLANLTRSALSAFLPAGAAAAPAVQSVQAPVNIHVTASGASPEAIGQSVYDTAQRSLLKTLKGVFA